MTVDDSDVRKRIYHPVRGKTLTRQADAAGADASTLVERWIKTGRVRLASSIPTYGDFSDGLSLHEAMERVRTAEANFADLPAAVRKACDNDPGVFLDQVAAAETREHLVELGLLEEDLPPAVQKVEVVNATPDPAETPEGE